MRGTMIRSFLDKQPNIEKSSYIDNEATIIGAVTIGKECSIWPKVVLRGDIHHIVIGDCTNIQDGTIVHVSRTANAICRESLPRKQEAGKSTIIGSFVTVGHNAVVHACTIENCVLIGMGAIVLDGAHISSESIVGAGALITKNCTFPPQSLILGSPAKAVRSLTDNEIASIKESAKNYLQLKEHYKQDEEAFNAPSSVWL